MMIQKWLIGLELRIGIPKCFKHGTFFVYLLLHIWRYPLLPDTQRLCVDSLLHLVSGGLHPEKEKEEEEEDEEEEGGEAIFTFW